MLPLTDGDSAHLTRALHHLQSGAWNEAWAELLAIMGPPQPLVLANLALTAEKRGDSSAARRYYEEAIGLAPHSAELRFNWGNFLAHQGESAAAREQFLSTLTLDSAHLGAWVNLGVILVESAHLSAARTAFLAALALQTRHGGALLNLAQVALHQQENQEAANLFAELLADDPSHREAHRGRASALSRLGQDAAATHHLDLAYHDHPIIEFPCRGPTQHRLLILASAQDGNIPWQGLIDRNHTHTRAIALEYFPHHLPLPPHDLLFNVIGDPDRCAAALQRAQHRWPQAGEVRNNPWRVAQSARDQLPRLAHNIPHLRVARCATYEREQGKATSPFIPWMTQQGWSFPLLLRTLGFHGGLFFERVNQPDEVEAIMARLPGKTLLVMELLPSQSADGLYRKYRIMTLGSQLYPLHLAISSHWKVHYFSADMADQAAYRAEEDRFLNHFPTSLPSQAITALNELQQRLGLDYAGLDFTLDQAGHVLLFEANATMVMAPIPEDSLWNYRRPAYQRAQQRARALFSPPKT